MVRSQRILIGVSLPLLAWLLHVNTCDWIYRNTLSAASQPSILTRKEMPTGTRGFLRTGLVTQPYVDRGTAAVWGIVAPLALIVADAYLILGWRNQSRISRGLCMACGYDLRAQTMCVTCPECGAEQREAAR